MSVRLSNESYYVDGGHLDIKQMMEESFRQNAEANQAYWHQGTNDLRFKAGDQTIWGELYNDCPMSQRKNFNFNRIRRIINMITGFQRKNRKATTAYAIEGADELTADQFTKIIHWANRGGDVYHTISEAFEGAITTGMNLLSTWVDYRFDPINRTGQACERIGQSYSR